MYTLDDENIGEIDDSDLVDESNFALANPHVKAQHIIQDIGGRPRAQVCLRKELQNAKTKKRGRPKKSRFNSKTPILVHNFPTCEAAENSLSAMSLKGSLDTISNEKCSLYYSGLSQLPKQEYPTESHLSPMVIQMVVEKISEYFSASSQNPEYGKDCTSRFFEFITGCPFFQFHRLGDDCWGASVFDPKRHPFPVFFCTNWEAQSSSATQQLGNLYSKPGEVVAVDVIECLGNCSSSAIAFTLAAAHIVEFLHSGLFRVEYEIDELISHLSECVETGVFSLFPSFSKFKTQFPAKRIVIRSFCRCHSASSKGMKFCIGCNRLLHYKCFSPPTQVAKKFVCAVCSINRSKSVALNHNSPKNIELTLPRRNTPDDNEHAMSQNNALSYVPQDIVSRAETALVEGKLVFALVESIRQKFVDPLVVNMLLKAQNPTLCRCCGLHVIDTDGDGHCGFRAISYQIFGTQDLYMLVRYLCFYEIKSKDAYYSALGINVVKYENILRCKKGLAGTDHFMLIDWFFPTIVATAIGRILSAIGDQKVNEVATFFPLEVSAIQQPVLLHWAFVERGTRPSNHFQAAIYVPGFRLPRPYSRHDVVGQILEIVGDYRLTYKSLCFINKQQIDAGVVDLTAEHDN